MPSQFAFVFTFLLCAFPLVFAIFFLFGEEISNFFPNMRESDFFSYFLFFGMAGVGLFVDSLRHCIEWTLEYAIEGNSRECAFWPRLHIEDTRMIRLKGTGIVFQHKNKYAYELFQRKMDRFESRYFAAEGMMSFALSSILASILYLCYFCYYWGETPRCLNDIPFAIGFKTIAVPFCIIGAFLWCRDKADFINRILGREIIKLCSRRRRWFFGSILVLYILSSILNFICYGLFHNPCLANVFLFSVSFCLAFLIYLCYSRPSGEFPNNTLWLASPFLILLAYNLLRKSGYLT